MTTVLRSKLTITLITGVLAACALAAWPVAGATVSAASASVVALVGATSCVALAALAATVPAADAAAVT